jgi:hypothetical protein
LTDSRAGSESGSACAIFVFRAGVQLNGITVEHMPGSQPLHSKGVMSSSFTPPYPTLSPRSSTSWMSSDAQHSQVSVCHRLIYKSVLPVVTNRPTRLANSAHRRRGNDPVRRRLRNVICAVGECPYNQGRWLEVPRAKRVKGTTAAVCTAACAANSA